MKKIIFILLFALTACSSTIMTSRDTLAGSWKIDNVVYTFSNDTLWIDELDNEGDEYSYTLIDNIVKARNDIDSIEFRIIRLQQEKLSVYFYGDRFTLYRIDNYNAYKFSEN